MRARVCICVRVCVLVCVSGVCVCVCARAQCGFVAGWLVRWWGGNYLHGEWYMIFFLTQKPLNEEFISFWTSILRMCWVRCTDANLFTNTMNTKFKSVRTLKEHNASPIIVGLLELATIRVVHAAADGCKRQRTNT